MAGIRTAPVTVGVQGDTTGLKQVEIQVSQAGERMKSGLGKGKQGADATSQAIQGLLGKLRGTVPGVDLLSDALRKVGGAGAGLSQVLGAMGPLLPAAAIAASAAAAKMAVDQFQKLALSVHEFVEVSGATAEQASQLSYLFNTVGISTDTGANAIFRMNKLLETSPQKFADVGIQVARDAQGNVDLVKTLEAVHEAYQNAGTAAERDTILFTAFGRSGRELAAVMELTNEQFDRIMGRAPMIDDTDMENAKQLSRNLNELKQQISAVAASIGREFVPGLIDAAGGLLDLVHKANAGSEAIRKMGGGFEYADAAGKGMPFGLAGIALAIYGVASGANEEAKKSKDAAQALEDHAEAADDLKKKLDALNAAELGYIGVTLSLEEANRKFASSGLKVEEAQSRVADADAKVAAAQEAYNQALRGGDPSAIAAAQRDLTQAQIDAKQAAEGVTQAEEDRKRAMDEAAQAAVKAAVTQAELSGQTLDADQKTNIYISTLKTLADKLGPNDPLRKWALETIATLDNVSRNRYGLVTIDAAGNAGDRLREWDIYLQDLRAGATVNLWRGGDAWEGPSYGGLQRQSGGPVVPRQLYLVGEQGPEWFMSNTAGRIYPHGTMPSAGEVGAGPTYNLTLVGTPVVDDPDGVRRMLNRLEAMGAAG